MKSILPGIAVLVIAALALTACAADPSQTPSFYTHLSLGEAGETIVIGEIRNAGYAAIRTMIGWHAVLQLRHEGGALVACQQTKDLTGSLRPGDSDFPLRWTGRLAPGAYRLTWGAPGLGGIRTAFRLVERDGALVLERDTTARIDGSSVPGAQDCAAGRGRSAGRAGEPARP